MILPWRLLSSLCLLLSIPGLASAHDLRLTVRLAPQTVRLEAGFDDDTPAQRARVTITDSSDRIVAEGQTDERGVWSCPMLPAGSYTAAVESAGHRDAVQFTVTGAGPAAFSGPRLDKTLGLALGLGAILVGVLLTRLLRSRRSNTAAT